MYGLVNQAVEDLVVSRFGADRWAAIIARTGMAIPEFSRMESYPDAMTFGLVQAACDELGLEAADVMRAFGEHWLLFTGQRGYGPIFRATGDDVITFLQNLDHMHARVGTAASAFRPPSFGLEALADGRYLLEYRTTRSRSGLCMMVEGLLTGLGKHFRQPLVFRHVTCDLRGDARCTFELEVGEPPA